MPVIVDDELSTRWMLESEGIFAIGRSAALRQDLRPLRIALVALEVSGDPLALGVTGLIADTPIQIELTPLGLEGAAHGPSWQLPWTQALRRGFDALIVTDHDAPQRAVDAAPHWDELRDLLDWADTAAHAHVYLGWSAYAALQHRHGVVAQPEPEPRAGIAAHRVRRRQSFLLRGFDDAFAAPVRRRWRIAPEDLDEIGGLEVLAESLDGQPYLVRNGDRRRLYVPHQPVIAPVGDGAAAGLGWRAHAALLFANWINYYVYQPTSRLVRGRDGLPAA